MKKRSGSDHPQPRVDKKTAKGKGEGGWSPHPETEKDKTAPFDPHSYRPNIEPPGVKPVGAKRPKKPSPKTVT